VARAIFVRPVKIESFGLCEIRLTSMKMLLLPVRSEDVGPDEMRKVRFFLSGRSQYC
jgi:hypothetical protein